MGKPLAVLSGLVVLNFLVFGMTACEEPKLPSPFHASEVAGKFAQADFKLTDHHGKPRTLADFRGKVVLLFFGYVHCPDVCPTTLADLAQAMQLLGDDAKRVQVLFVTVDPERDTTELLANYIPAFNADFLGLSGDAQATADVTRAFAVSYQKQPSKTSYNVDHSAGTYLIDGQGKVRLLASYGQSAVQFAQDIHLLLALSR
ncbi:MAG: SCO family protein [Sideroxydans sp.]|nr:SCO family protein [Sideroxydans sp.]